eukprot:TRINITY_DN2502_c0_g1_i2.p1 TRINITY_DN2502_c0_g1~~TRINITY_DN2502_c0_g1_i2.p1  ORF type:complete len:237 (-),score=34.43 TRINITY_DN2502_c0_g1_i2:125-835(-)
MRAAGLLVILCAAVVACAFVADAAYPKVKVQTFEMAKCPYCSQWKTNFENTVMKASGLKAIIDLTEFWVARTSGSDFICLHGPGECVGDLYLVCADNFTRNSATPWAWWDMSVCMQANNNYPNIPGNIQSCASKTGLDYSALTKCANGALGRKLFSDSINYCNKMNVHETPTTIINGVKYVGGSPNPLKTICDAYTGPKPSGCSNADQVAPFKFSPVTDDDTDIMSTLNSLLLGTN